MNWGLYGILIIFGAFILLLVFNPNLSCFGKQLRSPLYPFFRKRKGQKKKVEIATYGFSLRDEASKKNPDEERD